MAPRGTAPIFPRSRTPPTPQMFTVKCFSARATVYSCQVETSANAIVLAHLLAETYGPGYRSNVYKPGEATHFYNVTGSMDITERRFT